MKGRRDTFEQQQIAILNAEYEEEKEAARANGTPSRVSMAIIAKRHKLRPTVLKNWRANHLSRRQQ